MNVVTILKYFTVISKGLVILGRFILPSQDGTFEKDPVIMAIFISFSCLGYIKKIILTRHNLACMKTGSCLNGTFSAVKAIVKMVDVERKAVKAVTLYMFSTI